MPFQIRIGDRPNDANDVSKNPLFYTINTSCQLNEAVACTFINDVTNHMFDIVAKDDKSFSGQFVTFQKLILTRLAQKRN